MENNTSLAVSEQKQRTNPIKRAFTAVSTKFNRIITTVTAMLTMSVATSINAFAASTHGNSIY